MSFDRSGWMSFCVACVAVLLVACGSDDDGEGDGPDGGAMAGVDGGAGDVDGAVGGPDGAVGGPDGSVGGPDGAAAGPDAQPGTPDAAPAIDAAGGSSVTSTLVATGCSASFDADRVIVHYNTALGIVFTDAEAPYTVRGTISFDFPSDHTGAIPNPYSWVDSGIHREVAITDASYATWGNHCWNAGDGPTGGTGSIEVVNGPAGIVRATFNGFQLRHCVNHASTCTLSGSIESTETGTFE